MLNSDKAVIPVATEAICSRSLNLDCSKRVPYLGSKEADEKVDNVEAG